MNKLIAFGLSLLISIGAVSAQKLPRTVATIQELVSLPPETLKASYTDPGDTNFQATVVVGGRNAPGDGGGSILSWFPESSDSTNSGTVFAATYGAPVGRWKRSPAGHINVRWFGATGNGVTDDSDAIQAAIDHAIDTGGGYLFFPIGVYYIPKGVKIEATETRLIPRGIRLGGESHFQSCLYSDGTNKMFQCLPYSNYPITGTNGIRNRVEGVTLENLTFYGPCTNDSIYMRWMAQGQIKNVFIRTGGIAVRLKHAHMNRFQFTVGQSISTQYRPGYVQQTPPGGAVGAVNTYGLVHEPDYEDPDSNGVNVGILEENEFDLDISGVSKDGIFIQTGVKNQYRGTIKGTGGYAMRLNNCNADNYQIFTEVTTGNDSDGTVLGGGRTSVRMSGCLGNELTVWASTRKLWLTGGSAGNSFVGGRYSDVKFTSGSVNNLFLGTLIETNVDQSEYNYPGQLFLNTIKYDAGTASFPWMEHAGNIGTDFNKGLLKYADGTNDVKFFGPLRMLTKTSNYTVKTNDIYRIFSNLGAVGDTSFTLPPAAAGLGPYIFTVRQPGTRVSLIPDGADSIGDGASAATVTLDFNATVTLFATHSGRWIFQTYWGGQRMTVPSLSADPASPVDGQLWRRSDTDLFYLRKNSGTVQIPTINAAGAMAIGGGSKLSSGTANPEGGTDGNPGDIYLRNNAGAGEIWIKSTGTGNTGWTQISVP